MEASLTREGFIEELAPAVVVRAARFPLHSLFQLADSEFAASAATTDAQATPEFQESYDAVIQREQRVLYSLTIEDPAFMRALCITNDDLSRRVAARAFPVKRNKQARHLDTTLYGYLARAVWRTEPCDLWAGMTLASWGNETRVTAASARYAVSPDLRPYQFIVQILSTTPHYVEKGIYKLNPTLEFDEDAQCWKFTVRVFGAIVTREQQGSPAIDFLIHSLAEMQPASLGEIIVELRRLGMLDEELEDILAAFHGVGLLVGGLSFPRNFASAWDALLSVSRDLRPEHARAWRAFTRRLRRVCRNIERNMEGMSIATLHTAIDEARNIPVALARELNVQEPDLPRSVLRCDTRLPFSVVIGGEMKAALERAVIEYDCFERYHGIDAAARAAHRHVLLSKRAHSSHRTIKKGDVPTQEFAWLAGGADSLLGERLRRLSARLKAESGGIAAAPDNGCAEVSLPPIAGLMVRPRARGYRIIGSTPEVSATYCRYGQVWYGQAHRRRHRFDGHPLHEWYQAALAKVARECNVAVVEYVGPCEGLPNALARPRFNFPIWDRWGTATSYRADDLRVDISNRASVPLVYAAWSSRPVSLTCFSPVNLGFSEPRLERLLLSSFREIPAWIPPGLPLECELRSERPSPALTLPNGDTIRLRRTLLHGALLEEFVAAGRARRFLLWQNLARIHSWPSLVLVARDGGRSLPVVRDSALAVEAVFHGLREGVVRFISIEEPDDNNWLLDDKGSAFASELVVPFSRRRHAWSDLAAN